MEAEAGGRRGPTVGRYRLGRRLGAGGMAEVFVATHEGAAGFERPVCIKRILPHLSRDSEFRELFVHEAKLAGRLSHAAIVQVFDCIEDGDTLAIVMELVSGMDLRGLTRALGRTGDRLAEGVVAHVAGQLLGALRFAHQQQVIHRDVSPHNVLVSREGEVKLADFGVAKALRSQATRTGEIKGKLAYMSPEQARAEQVDARTDLYSTGLVLYELIVGERFFPSLHSGELVSAVVNAKEPHLDGTSPELARLVERLLAPRADDRYESAEAALRDLPPWELTGPLGAIELGAAVSRLVEEESAPATREDPRVPAAALEGGDPEGTDLLPGGTEVSPGGGCPRPERPIIPLPSDAVTITRGGDDQRLLEVAPTAEASSGTLSVDGAPTLEDRPRLLEESGGGEASTPPASAPTETEITRRPLGSARLAVVVLAVLAVLGGSSAIGYRLVAWGGDRVAEPSGPSSERAASVTAESPVPEASGAATHGDGSPHGGAMGGAAERDGGASEGAGGASQPGSAAHRGAPGIDGQLLAEDAAPGQEPAREAGAEEDSSRPPPGNDGRSGRGESGGAARSVFDVQPDELRSP